LKSNGDALKGLKVSSVRGGKEALQEVFRQNEKKRSQRFLLRRREPAHHQGEDDSRGHRRQFESFSPV
jgi:hypothetical protein